MAGGRGSAYEESHIILLIGQNTIIIFQYLSMYLVIDTYLLFITIHMKCVEAAMCFALVIK